MQRRITTWYSNVVTCDFGKSGTKDGKTTGNLSQKIQWKIHHLSHYLKYRQYPDGDVQELLKKMRKKPDPGGKKRRLWKILVFKTGLTSLLHLPHPGYIFPEKIVAFTLLLPLPHYPVFGSLQPANPIVMCTLSCCVSNTFS
jgi:hypothetical protein